MEYSVRRIRLRAAGANETHHVDAKLMLFFAKAGIMTDQEIAHLNKRKAVRKPMHARGKVSSNTKLAQFTSIDIGPGGICILLPDQLTLGEIYKIDVSMFINGRKMDVSSKAKACYCICGSDGFKVGLQFVNLDEASAKTIDQYLK
jgi:hypothetical protein